MKILTDLQNFFNNITYGSRIIYSCRDFTMNRTLRNILKFFVFPVGIIKYFMPPKSCINRKGLAIVLIVKNEANYIQEWINFHVKQGVSHFIIYDNESTDNLFDVLKKYIASGLVSYKFLRGKARQYDAYNMAMHDYRYKFKYLAVIDADEFLFLRKNTYWWGGGITIYMILLMI